MFNLIVSADSRAWEEPLCSIMATRFKEYSGRESEEISISRKNSLRALEGIPTLLMYELGCGGINTRTVRHGTLKNIRVEDGRIWFSFVADPDAPYFTRGTIQSHAGELGIHRFENTRTHWAIKDGDLPSTLLEKARTTPPTINLDSLARELVDATKTGANQYEIIEALIEFEPSVDKTVALYRAKCENAPVPEMLPYVGLRPKTSQCRKAVSGILAMEGDLLPETLVWFLDRYGGPSERPILKDAVERCRSNLTALAARCAQADNVSAEEIATAAWRISRSKTLVLELRREVSGLLDRLVQSQKDGAWAGGSAEQSARATAIACVALQRLGDDRFSEVVTRAVDKLLVMFLEEGALPDDTAGSPEVPATVFGLEALRRSKDGADLDYLLEKGDRWLLEKQDPTGTWKSSDWDEDFLTAIVVEYLQGKSGLLSQVDGFFLMARDFHRKADELAHEGGLNNRRLAVISAVHSIEMFLYGLFDRRDDLGLSAYREDLNQTLGPRESLGKLEKALLEAGIIPPKKNLAYRDQLSSMIGKRDMIIHHAHEVTEDEVARHMRESRSFIEKYCAELLLPDILQ